MPAKKLPCITDLPLETLHQHYQDEKNSTDKKRQWRLAVWENDIWAKTPSGTGLARSKYLATLKVDEFYYISNREELVKYGKDSDVTLLWLLIADENLGTRAAVEMLHAAEKMQKENGISLREALEFVISDRKKNWVPRTWKKDGTQYYAKPQKQARTKEELEAVVPDEGIEELPFSKKARWEQVRAFLRLHFHDIFGDGYEALQKYAEREIEMVITDLRRVQHAQLQEKKKREKVTITRQQVVDACEFLKIEIPEERQPADLQVARRARSIRLHAYSSDKTGIDTPATRKEVEDALTTYQVLRDYNEQIKERKCTTSKSASKDSSSPRKSRSSSPTSGPATS